MERFICRKANIRTNFEIGSLLQTDFHYAEKKIRINGSFVCFINDHDWIGGKIFITTIFIQEYVCGDKANSRRFWLRWFLRMKCNINLNIWKQGLLTEFNSSIRNSLLRPFDIRILQLLDQLMHELQIDVVACKRFLLKKKSNWITKMKSTTVDFFTVVSKTSID